MAQYYRPESLAEALQYRQQGCDVIAGATDVYPAQTQRHAWGAAPIVATGQHWLDVTAISEFKGITLAEDWIRIGARVTWSELINADLPAGFDALQAAAREVGGMQIQNRATVVGNLCNASPAADGVPPLLCLDAEVELVSESGQRQMPVQDFLVANRQTRLAEDELVAAVWIPAPVAQYRSAFYKLGARRYLVISITMAAIALDIDDQGKVNDARVAVGACSATACRIHPLEQRLIGQDTATNLRSVVLAEDFQVLQPIDDVRATADYRKQAAVEVCRRLLNALSTREARV